MASSEEGVAPSAGSRMSHSHSSPAGVQDDTATEAVTEAKQRSGKLMAVSVIMLDELPVTFHVQPKVLGQALFELVCKQLSLLEVDYFGLEYEDSGKIKYWLDCEKAMNRQLGLSLVDCTLRFGVKFYTPDPAQLEEEYTRYLLCLQLKRDLSTGTLLCNDNTAALMASYIVQADCGDYVADDYPDHTYLSSYKFVPHQDQELERRIMENHKKHVGQSPAEADLNLLETARRCDLFGVRMHPAKDHEGVPLNLAVAHMGVLVFQNYTKINTFSWAKIRKLSFKRKRFLIKLHPEGYASPGIEGGPSNQGYYKDIVEFFFDGRNECKSFWKKCVEHHGFFRCCTVKKMPRQKARVISRGSSFRYSGRTHKQVVDFVRDNYIKRQPFQRSQSFRHSSSAHSSIGHMGASKSAQPLLPVGDHPVGTPASQSCGSMVLNDSDSTEALAAVASSSPGSLPRERMDAHSLASGDSGTSPAASPRGGHHSTTTTTTPERHYHHQLSNGKEHRPDGTADEEILTKSPRHKKSPAPKPPTSTLQQTTITPVSSPAEPPAGDPVDEEPVQKSEDAEVDMRRKRYPTDNAYFIAKEILTTERTYKKDLEVINLWFRNDINRGDQVVDDSLENLFALIDPIYEFHLSFLREIEQRLAKWEGRSNAHLKGDFQRIGDILLNNMSMLDLYKDYLSDYPNILEKLDQMYLRNRKFEQLYKDFEGQKVCYLPLNTFVLKPVHRLMHYKMLLERLFSHYSLDHPDSADCKTALTKLKSVTADMAEDLRKAENFAKLVELQRDIIGVDNLMQPGREFIREGCLQKLSKKGFQQRMFFLMSDVLLYANRAATINLQFKSHGQISLRGIAVESCESRLGAQNCFAIYSNNKPLIVSASTPEEKDKWLEDLNKAVQVLKERKFDKFLYSNKSCSSSDEVLDSGDYHCDEEMQSPSRPVDKPSQQRSNTTVHVCWHRNTSVSMRDHARAIENQLSGYLLRKFKSSNGWQKLWVVFTNFCLFFYKTFQDDFPLASLPLLGYIVTTPSEKDNINKDYVFKLQFKNHVYFFRAESEYSYNRWMEVICCATQHSGRMRLFSRSDSVSES